MSRRPIGILSIGVFIIILAVLLLANATVPDTVGWGDVIPLLLAFYGIWIMVLGGLRAKSPGKYERGAFSTFAWGLLFAVVGGAWYSNNHGLPAIYTAVLVLLVVGVLVVAVAFKGWRRHSSS
ncbi:MAG: hypothetical protein QXE76_03535 [Candidatus Bathyarchaeia archaeon]